MMKCFIFHCREGAQYRLGEGTHEATSLIIHSDTIFSTITTIWQNVFGDAKTFIDEVKHGNCTFSSGYFSLLPSWTSDPIVFLPKPPIHFSDYDDMSKNKRMRKIRFFSLGLIKKISETGIEQGNNRRWESSVNILENMIINDNCVMLRDELKTNNDVSDLKFYEEITLPKVKVHTLINENRLYHETTIQVNTITLSDNKSLKPILCVLMKESEDDEIMKKIQCCLRVAADEGFGGGRSTGAGIFSDVEQRDIQIPNKNNIYMTLSLLSPANQDEFDKVFFYDICKRGGGSLGKDGDANRHRKELYMIAEGALMKNDVSGLIRDVSPEDNLLAHPIYRSGISLSIGL